MRTEKEVLGELEDALDNMENMYGLTCDRKNTTFLQRAADMMRMYSVSGEELLDNLMAIALKAKRRDINAHMLEIFAREKTKQLETVINNMATPKQQPKKRAAPIDFMIGDDDREGKENIVQAALNRSVMRSCFSLEAELDKKSTMYAERRGAKETALEHTGPLFVGEFSRPTTSCLPVDIASSIPEAWTFGNDKTASFIDSLTESLDDHFERVRQANQDVGKQFESVTKCSEADQIIAGVVVDETPMVTDGESTTDRARLSVDTIAILQTEHDCEQRPVDVGELPPPYSLFPGQHVVLRARNPNGDRLIASRILTAPPPPFRSIMPTVGKFDVDSRQPDMVRVMSAVGPFCPPDSSLYEPLVELLDVVKQRRPHVLFLQGPLVDVEHEACRSVKAKYTALEATTIVLDGIAKHLAGTGIVCVVQMDAQRDAAALPILPTPVLDFDAGPEVRAAREEGRLHLAPDPCVVRVNGISVALTCSDPVRRLCAADLCCTGDATDRQAAVLGHLIEQRRIFPLLPTSVPTHAADLLQDKTLDQRPHVLLTPSVLRPWIKELSGVLCLNAQGRSHAPLLAQIDIAVSLMRDGAYESAADYCHARIERV